jgi:glyoxylase-like metal-dependent hydrolase (beta-lactamase superfamily II)
MNYSLLSILILCLIKSIARKSGLPNETFKENLDLKLNGIELNLKEIGSPGVSSNQTVVHIPSLNALIVGDLIHHKAHAWLEGGIVNAEPVPNLKNWKLILASLPSKFGSQTLVYAGRGEKTTLNDSVLEQIKYLDVAERVVETQLKLSEEKNIKVSNDSMPSITQNITKALEVEFPSFSYPYLVQYGVYGLVLQQNKRSVSK